MSELPKLAEQHAFQDSGLSSFGSESDSSPVAQQGSDAGCSAAAPAAIPKQTGGGRSMGIKSRRYFSVTYLGEHVLDRRYTQQMLPWIMAAVRRRNERKYIYLEVLSHSLRGLSLPADCDSGSATETATPLFEHKLQSLSRFARTHQDQKCFAYLTRAHVDTPFTCHVFQANEEGLVPELFTAIREATRAAVKDAQLNVSTNEGRSVDVVDEFESANLYGRLFEVMYIGKVKVKDKKGPPTIIDEAVEMFQVEERKKAVTSALRDSKRCRNASETSVKSLPINIERSVSIKENELSENNQNNRQNQSLDSCLSSDTTESSSNTNESSSSEQIDNGNIRLDLSGENVASTLEEDPALDGNQNKKSASERAASLLQGTAQQESLSTSLEDLHATARPRGAHSTSNRVLLIQVGQYELCLISPDKKTVILERKFRDISFCFQGINHPEHFGFNTRDTNTGSFVCYVFRCSSKPVVEEIMQALQQAFHSAFQQSVKNHVVCELCPMHQLHKLCQEIEGLPPSRVFEILQQRVDQLNEKDYNEVMTGFKAEGLATDQDKCEVMMILLRQMCEAKQREHTHISDTNKALGKTEFYLMDKYKPSKFDNFKSKAKKSLAHSFENLIYRGKTKREEAKESFRDRSWTTESDASNYTQSFDSAYTPGSTPEQSPCTSPTSKVKPAMTVSTETLELRQNFTRRRSATIGALPDVTQLQHSPVRNVNQMPVMEMSVPHPAPSPSRTHHDHLNLSPRRAMYEQVSSSAGSGGGGAGWNTQESLTVPSMNGSVSDRSRSPTPSADGGSSAPVTPQRKQSWRLGILNRVVTPARVPENRILEAQESEREGAGDKRQQQKKSSLSQTAIRALWRKAILETLLLIRMEKENISLQARQDAAEIKRVKLDYQEIVPCLKEITKVWEEMLATPGRPIVKLDQPKLHDAVKSGVPRHQRGDIWALLVEQHQLHRSSVTTPSEGSTRYEDQLKQLTTHQHAILIDLGRTFPGHPYFARQLGAGQLSLFNLLKAYSLTDREVGYCQGLSFVAGVLLMHMREEQAFETLKHLMFRLGFRRQYRPDMVALQIQMYQLSRLLHDMYRDLYEHLERHDIAPTLYAAPWFLTLFASQFPLGFVARVFDLIFLQGMEVVFKVALVLLGDHRELIKQCNSFETVVEFLKTTLPSMSIIQMERVINQVFQLDISKQLHAYEVEYHVLQEEMISSPQRGDADLIAKLEGANHSLKRQNMELIEQLQTSHSNQHSLEIQINNLLASETKLRSHIRTLEIERMALLQTVTKLRQLIPPEVVAAQQINIPSVYPDVTFTSSPHSPSLNQPPIQQDPTLSPRSALSPDVDAEVASVMSGCHQNGPTQQRPPTRSPVRIPKTSPGRTWASLNQN